MAHHIITEPFSIGKKTLKLYTLPTTTTRSFHVMLLCCTNWREFLLHFAQHNLLVKEIMGSVFPKEQTWLITSDSFNSPLSVTCWKVSDGLSSHFPPCHLNHQSRLCFPLTPLLSSCQRCETSSWPGDLLAFDVSIVAPWDQLRSEGFGFSPLTPLLSSFQCVYVSLISSCDAQRGRLIPSKFVKPSFRVSLPLVPSWAVELEECSEITGACKKMMCLYRVNQNNVHYLMDTHQEKKNNLWLLQESI